MPPDLEESKWTEQALKVLHERYLMKNDLGEVVETPSQMCWRVAWDIASAEIKYGRRYEEVLEVAKEFYEMLSKHHFLPNSPTLMNAGKGNGLQYNGCFVIPVEDSIEGIFDGIKYAAIIHKSGGGTGFAFSRLRSSGARVGSTKGVASGPVSFLKVYDAATEQIKQGGSRRGANMGVLRIDHPDVLEFIHCKEDGGITNFNISLAATDAFMRAYFDDKDYDLIDPKTKKVTGQLSARKVMDEIADGAWKTGDPGMIFIDKINEGSANPVPSLGPIETTNPCGEQPLYPFDACNLGSIFLTYFVKEENGKKVIDWNALEKTTNMAVRFLDDVIERNPIPLQQITDVVEKIRRIGLGVGGWADMLILLGIPYDSEEAVVLAEKIMKFINNKGHETSEELAVERGPFPLWGKSIYKDGKQIRNATVTTIAPTGTIGHLAGTSQGIEPVFAIAYKHYVKTNALERSLYYFNSLFEEMYGSETWFTNEVKEKIAEQGTIAHIEEIPEEVRKLFVTAHDISPEWHVRTQAAFQKYTDNAVSKTINMPNSSTAEDIKKAYIQAYETGCRGITVYRDGSKSIQVLNLGTKDKKEEQPVSTNGHQKIEMASLRPRPEKLSGSTYRILTPVGHAFITVNSTEAGDPFEIFLAVGHAGSEVAADAEAIGRLVSMSLRIPSALSPNEISSQVVDQLRGIGGASSVGFGMNRVKSLADAVAKILDSHLKKDVPAELSRFQTALPLTIKKDLCPSCGAAAFVYEEGCAKCHACGYAKC